LPKIPTSQRWHHRCKRAHVNVRRGLDEEQAFQCRRRSGKATIKQAKVRLSEIAVIGSGPAAMLSALAAARGNRCVRLYVEEPGSKPGAAIESVQAAPASIISLLVEFGVAPAQLGVSGTNSVRQIRWETEQPMAIECESGVHLERPALERALLAQVLRCNRVAIEATSYHGPSWDGMQWNVGSHEADYLIDATGRRAITARCRVAPEIRWFASLWQFLRPRSDEAISPLAIASLPGGYAYRISSRRVVTLATVGPALGKIRRYDDLREILDQSRAAWIARGLSKPSCNLGSPTNSSVQWSADTDGSERHLVRIGDASLAREPLSSQGIAAALSDALYAVEAIDNGQLHLLEMRQREQRKHHVESLRRILARSVHCESAEWSEYRRWLEQKSFPDEALVGLRDRHLRIVKSTGFLS
jgi:flavin-dependent dehydrogenase